MLFLGDLGMVRTILFVNSPHWPTGVRGNIASTLAGGKELGFGDGLAHAAQFRAITAIVLDVSGTTAFVASGRIHQTRIQSVDVTVALA